MGYLVCFGIALAVSTLSVFFFLPPSLFVLVVSEFSCQVFLVLLVFFSLIFPVVFAPSSTGVMY